MVTGSAAVRRPLAFVLALSCALSGVSQLAIAQPAPAPDAPPPDAPPAQPSPWMPGSDSAPPPADPNAPAGAPGETDPAVGPSVPVAGGSIDLAPNGVLEPIAEEHRHHYHPRGAVIGMAGLYAGFIGWMYYAWYRKHKPLSDYKFGGDGWLGARTYAGGEDKFGHAWATMSLARVGTELLTQVGGFDRTKSIFISAAMSELLFIGVEVKDGFFYEFSFSDISGDTAGFIMALALQLWPRLDELFDYRVQYFPSKQYYNQVSGTAGAPIGGKLNIAEDYSGQTYLFAFHLGGIHALRDNTAVPWLGTASRFVDLAFAFDTRGYKPEPASGPLPIDQHHQNFYLGVSFNAQGFFDWLFTHPTHHDTLRKFFHAGGEVFNLPYTFGPLIHYQRTPNGPITQDGA